METNPNKLNGSLNNPPTTLKGKLAFVGPGLVVAASGVGAGDFTMAIIAGQGFGLVLLWTIVAGALIKFFLSEGIGRWYLATGKTFLQGWHSLGWWATTYFGIYIIFFGIIYGAAEPSISALVMTAMFPGTPFWLWAIASGLAGFFLVWFGRYQVMEKVMMGLIGLMFLTVIGSAVIILANLGEVSYGVVPSVPEGSFFRILGIFGGVGGSITLTSYAYWIHAKGWRGKKWLPVMKIDISVAYIITAVFAIAIMIIAAELLFGTGTTISGNDGLVTLANTYGERFGSVARWILLLGFWAAVFTSIVGPWHGISYLFADFVRIFRNGDKETQDTSKPISEKNPWFRAYLAWMTFPPMLLLLFQKPVAIVLLYGIFGAVFMPLLAIALLFLLNSKQVDLAYRNGSFNNIILGLIVLLYVYLGGSELYHSLF